MIPFVTLLRVLHKSKMEKLVFMGIFLGESKSVGILLILKTNLFFFFIYNTVFSKLFNKWQGQIEL